MLTFLMNTAPGALIRAQEPQELDAVLEAHYKAASQQKMEQIETMITIGKNSYTMAGIESSFTIFRARPDLIRIEGEFQGSGVVQTYNGQQGWIYAPGLGIPRPREIVGDELENLLNQSVFGSPLWNFEEKGRTLELLDPVDGNRDHRIRMTGEDGNETIFTIDADSYLISGMTTNQVMGGTQAEVVIELKDYKKVKGIPMARYMVTKMNGDAVSTVEIEKVSFNKKVDPELFSKPETE